jgi:hypothetical protein
MFPLYIFHVEVYFFHLSLVKVWTKIFIYKLILISKGVFLAFN